MGNLTEMQIKMLNATVQVLEKAGVKIEDFDNLRKYPGFLERATRELTRPRAIMTMATGSDEKMARMAVHEVLNHMGGEQKMLIEICARALLDSVAILAMNHLPEHERYHVARLHNSTVVVRAAAESLGWQQLWAVLTNEVWDGWRFQIFEDLYAKQNGRPSGIKLPQSLHIES